MTTTQWWREFTDRAAVFDVLRAFALRPRSGRGESATYAFPHANCPGEHGDGRGAVYFGRRSRRLHCRKCDASFGVLELTAALLGDELPQAPWEADDPVLRPVRDFGASNGWCTLEESRPLRRPAVRPTPRKPAPRWSPTRVAREFRLARAQPQRWAGELRAWCHARSWPEDIIESALSAGPNHTPVPDVGWAHDQSSELARLSQLVGRPLLFAIRDGEGRVRSVSRRVTGPRQLLPKAMALANKLVGQTADWPGRCRAFGSIPAALDRCAGGGRIFLCEGAPDFMVASALVHLGFGHAALAGDSASQLPKIAAELAKGIRARRLGGVEVILLPDLKWVDGETGPVLGGEGLERMQRAGELLAGWAQVTEVHLPVGAGRSSVDLSDVAARCRSADHLVRLIEGASTTLHAAYPDLRWPEASGYLPPVEARPGQVTVLRASLGAGKTQRAAELVAALPTGATAIAVTHRRSLSRQLASRLGLPCYEDLSRGRIREGVAICVNSLRRLDPDLVASNRLLVIDEVESVLTHLFGATLAHDRPDRPSTATVAGALRGLIRGTLAAGGQVVLADAHAHETSVQALLDFAGLSDLRPRFVDHHCALIDTEVVHHPSKAALVEALTEHLAAGRRAAVATDSRRLANGLAQHLRDLGHRIRLYTGDMPEDRRAELADVDVAWAPAECDAVIYTPVVDAGVSYAPPDPADRFDAVFGLFVGAANFGATTIHQMMFRARGARAHHVHMADRSDERPITRSAIRREIAARTAGAEHRVTLTGLGKPTRHRFFGALLDLETEVVRLQRLRTRRLRAQVLALYEIRGVAPTAAAQVPKRRRRQITRALAKAEEAAADERARRILSMSPLLPDAYVGLRDGTAPDQATADQLELSRLVRLVGAANIDHELVVTDERGTVTRGIRRAARLRLAFEGYWDTLAEGDRLGLIGGFGARQTKADLPVLAATLEALLPRDFWLVALAPAPQAKHPPEVEWSAALFAQTDAHLHAAARLDQLAAVRGVEPDDCLAGIRTRRADLLTPQGACTFVGAVLRWCGLGSKLRRERRGRESPLRIRRLDPAAWARMAELCRVENARVRGFAPDPLCPVANPWTDATDDTGWRAPLDATRQLSFDFEGGRITLRTINDPEPGSPPLQERYPVSEWAQESTSGRWPHGPTAGREEAEHAP